MIWCASWFGAVKQSSTAPAKPAAAPRRGGKPALPPHPSCVDEACGWAVGGGLTLSTLWRGEQGWHACLGLSQLRIETGHRPERRNEVI